MSGGQPERFGIIISNIEENMTEEVLYAKMKQHQIENIFSIRTPLSNKNFLARGYSFIYFNDLESSKKARNLLNLEKLLTQEVQVALIVNEFDKMANLFFRNIDPKVSAKEFDQFMTQFGTVVSSRLRQVPERTSFAFVQFMDTTESDKCKAEFDGNAVKLGETRIECLHYLSSDKRPIIKNNIYLKNFAPPLSPDDIGNQEKIDQLEKELHT